MDQNDSQKNHEAILEKLDMLIGKMDSLACECDKNYSAEKHEDIFKVIENNNKMLAEIKECVLKMETKA